MFVSCSFTDISIYAHERDIYINKLVEENLPIMKKIHEESNNFFSFFFFFTNIVY